MKNLKKIMFVALLGAISFGAFSTYDYLTMSAEEKSLLENIEALTSNEGGGGSGVIILEKGQAVTYPNSANRFWGQGCKEEKGSTCIIKNNECSGGMSLDIIMSTLGVIVSIIGCFA